MHGSCRKAQLTYWPLSSGPSFCQLCELGCTAKSSSRSLRLSPHFSHNELNASQPLQGSQGRKTCLESVCARRLPHLASQKERLQGWKQTCSQEVLQRSFCLVVWKQTFSQEVLQRSFSLFFCPGSAVPSLTGGFATLLLSVRLETDVLTGGFATLLLAVSASLHPTKH